MRRILAACAAVAFAAVAVIADPPHFSHDYTSQEEDLSVTYQGPYVEENGVFCCGASSCEVQTQYQSGFNYVDYSHNRTRFNDPVNGDIVALFHPEYKEMLVVNNTCSSWCPLGDDLFPYEIDHNATNLGNVTINGRQYEQWQFKQMAFKIVVMETDNTYVDMTVNPPAPAYEMDYITPFGEPEGEFTTTYLQFTPGAPSASLFDIAGIKECQKSQNCNNDAYRQALRLRWGATNTWLAARQASKAVIDSTVYPEAMTSRKEVAELHRLARK